MKNSKLMIGLGIGALLLGTAAVACLMTSDEKRREIMDDIDDAVKKAKTKIKNAVDSSVYEIEEAAYAANRMTKETLDNVKSQL